MANAKHNHLEPFFPKSTRIDNMTIGADEAIAWLADVIDNGLTALYTQPEDFWEGISKRMVDAQLSGISNKIKHLSRVVGVEDEEYIIDLISEIYLIAKSIKKVDQFPFDSQLSFLNSGGYNITKKQLTQAEKIQDDWLILGVISGEDEKIKFRRTWIQGVKSKFMGLILDYAWGKQEFMQNWQAGRVFQGDVRVYPGAYKLRVLVENHNYATYSFDSFASYPHIEAFLKAYTVAIAKQPVLQRFPVCLKDISVQMKENTLVLVDTQLDILPLIDDSITKWSLFSASAGQKISIFAEWDGRTIHPLSALSQGRFIKIKK